jgi:pyruvate/2-oxoglutarate dehydrogenase complex dihydrolipoamide dehydrogenase (E3) component
MHQILKPDLCVIGAGSGGLSVAAIAASFGVSVLLIEQHKMGGECLNVGCVPSKALIAAATDFHRRNIISQGMTQPPAILDFSSLMARVQHVIDAIAPNDSIARFTAMGVQVIKEKAHFIDKNSVAAGDYIIKARRFMIATGSRPAIPAVPGLETAPYLTNETIFNLSEQPSHLAILGGGPIGVELGQAFRRLGSQVTILQNKGLLPREDPEMATVLERALLKEGVDLRLHTTLNVVEQKAGSLHLHLQDGTVVMASHLLIAAGRKANFADLALEKAGIAADASGIVVDKGLCTLNRRVYAIGDCAGGKAAGAGFTHSANAHAGLIIRSSLFRMSVNVESLIIPRVVYSDPECASVGLSEQEARAQHSKIRILRSSLAENDRAQAQGQKEGQMEGHIKVITTAKGRILGCTIVAPHAGDLISLWTLALQHRMNIKDIAGLIMPYPTLSEMSKRAAVEFLKPLAGQSGVRRLIKMLRLFG